MIKLRILAFFTIFGMFVITNCYYSNQYSTLDDTDYEDGFVPTVRLERERIRAKVNSVVFYLTKYPRIEQKFNGKMHKNIKKGTYNCVICNEHLFDSSQKYETDFGFPTFHTASENVYQVTLPGKIKNSEVNKQVRHFLRCKHCGAYLGVVFLDDTTSETGKRYSVNAYALKFWKDGKKVEALLS